MDYEILEQIKEEHKKQGNLILEIENLFEEVRKNLDLEKLKQLQNIIKTLKSQLQEHFYLEESKLFPAILSSNNKLLIKDLEKEHIELLALLDEINKNIQRILNNEHVWAELRYNLKEFLHILNDHILKEDYQLLP